MNPRLNIRLTLCMFALAFAAIACSMFSPAKNPAAENAQQNDSTPAQSAPASTSAETAPASTSVEAGPTSTSAEAAPTSNSAEAGPTSVSIVTDAATTVQNVITASTKAPAYRTTITTLSTDSIMEITAEVILPDRFHITSKLKDKTTEMIVVDGKAYTRTNGAWTESKQDIGSLTASFASAVGKDTTISDAKFVKADLVNGKPALVYSFNSLYKSEGLQINTATMMWVDPLIGLPIKMVNDSEYNGIKAHTEQTIEYDPTITIVAPQP